MRLRSTTGIVVAVLLLGSLAVQATVRINGNQLLEGSATFGRNVQRSVGSGAVEGAPAVLIYSVGQGVLARGSVPDSASGEGVRSVAIGLGLAYDIATVVYNVFCPVVLTGDTDGDGSINADDIITFVNYVYKSGPAPKPCPAAADVNCSGEITTADCMLLVNYVFRSGEPPCDVCELIPGVWTCP
jgi:hypothetical protein